MLGSGHQSVSCSRPPVFAGHEKPNAARIPPYEDADPANKQPLPSKSADRALSDAAYRAGLTGLLPVHRLAWELHPRAGCS